jgi:hypothetical protein
MVPLIVEPEAANVAARALVDCEIETHRSG